jgi:SnoaL-like domain
MDSDISNRLRTVEDRLAIIDLEGTYARLFDSRRGAEWAALFVPEGSYQVRTSLGPSDEPGRVVRGHEALTRMCNDVPVSGIHLLNVPQVTIDGDRATSRVHFSFHSQEARHGTVQHRSIIGYYDVAYQRIDGHWLIERRVTTWFRHVFDDALGYAPTGAFDDAQI